MNENKLKIGHTGITWLNDDDFEDAIRTIAKEGFGGIELFGWTLPKIKAQGKLGLFEECGLPLWSGYFSHDVINPDRRQEQFNKIKEQGEILLSQGGTHVAFGGDIVDRRKVKYLEHRDYIVDFVNECGKRMQDMGLTLCYHPHTGTPVETKEEIMDFFQRIDPKYVAMAPDIGQIQKGGATRWKSSKPLSRWSNTFISKTSAVSLSLTLPRKMSLKESLTSTSVKTARKLTRPVTSTTAFSVTAWSI